MRRPPDPAPSSPPSTPARADGGRAAPDAEEGARVLVLNPASGGGDHADRVRTLADDHGFAVRETEGDGDAIRFAREAASEGADLVAAAGGDGTLNEVVRGIVEADALGETVFGVVPAGTGNNFAGNVGVRDVDHAFEVIETGETREIDLGFAGDRPFVNSCIGGLTAEASASTDPETKSSLGVLAYVLNTFRTIVDFEGLRMAVETAGSAGGSWSGEAVMLLIGNGRRFPVDGDTQADMEDGLLDVTIIEERPAVNLVGEAALTRLLGTDTDVISRVKTPELTLRVLQDDPVSFSLDGEMIDAHDLTVTTRTRALPIRVGPDYDPTPES